MTELRFRLQGLIAATYTPMFEDGALNLAVIPAMVKYLRANGIDGLYVCGSTGEGVSLSSAERKSVAEAFVSAAAGHFPVVVQVGHNSLAEARELALHAMMVGAAAVSTMAPSYYELNDAETLADCVAQIASAVPQMPLYYYHIPRLTGLSIDMLHFLGAGAKKIPNLVGLKYSSPWISDYQSCVELEGGRFDCLWGCDEMLLSALVVGCRGAVGSSYNVAGPLYRRLIDAFESGNLAEARLCQSTAVELIRRISRYPYHPAMKQIMKISGVDCGFCRLPHLPLTAEEEKSLRNDLEDMNYPDWSR